MTASGDPSARSTSSRATGSAWTRTDRRKPHVDDDQFRYDTFRSNSEPMSRCGAAPAMWWRGGLR
jgi:hypothetical protein